MLLFTRPLPKLNTTAKAFDAAGVNAVGVATTDIVQVVSEHKAALLLLTTNAIDVVIVTSVYAVKTVLTAMQDYVSAHDSYPIFVAVGDATARKLREGLPQNAAQNVVTPESHTSEGIVAMHYFNEANDQHVVIMKGEGGRQAIAEGLAREGRMISTFCVYRRELLTQPVYTKRWKIADVSGIIATSEAMATQLISHYGNALLTLPWVTVSERIATSLNRLGASRVQICHRATDQALIAWVKDNWEY